MITVVVVNFLINGLLDGIFVFSVYAAKTDTLTLALLFAPCYLIKYFLVEAKTF